MTAAAEATGVPLTTLDYWMDKPEFVALRTRAREEMADEAVVVARVGWGLLAARLAQMEDRDLINTTQMATEKALLMSGEATSRSEHRDIGDADESAVDTIEGVLAGRPWEVPARVVTGRNGAKSNGSH